MRIAILLAGHLRSWEFCKNPFIEKFIDPEHEIDIFVDTYNEIESSFPTNYQHLVGENALFKSNDEIEFMLSGLNVVQFNVESEIQHKQYKPQADKLEQSYNFYKNYVNVHNIKYDLVVRSRFDLMLEQKINYNHVYEKCGLDQKFLFQSHINGINFGRDLNDQFAISNPIIMDMYFKRFSTLFPSEVSKNWCIFHSTLRGLTDYFGITRDWNYFHNALVRTGPDNTFNIIW